MVVGSPTSAPQARSVATAAIVPIGGRISPDMIASPRDNVVQGSMAMRPIVGVLRTFFETARKFYPVSGFAVFDLRIYGFRRINIDDRGRAASPASRESPTTVHAVTCEPIVPILAASRLAAVTRGWPAVPANEVGVVKGATMN